MTLYACATRERHLRGAERAPRREEVAAARYADVVDSPH